MKVKTSITLSESVLCRLDEELGPKGNRSELIEKLLRRHLREAERARNFDREVALLNAIVDGAEPPEPFADPFAHGDPAHQLLDDVDVAG